MNNTISPILTFAAAILALVFGLTYILRPRFMTYHGAAIHKRWQDLQPEVRTLIIALMRAVGGGFLAVAAAISLLEIEFLKNNEPAVALAMLVTGIAAAAGTLYAVLLIRTRTHGRPPLALLILFIALLLAGSILNMLSR